MHRRSLPLILIAALVLLLLPAAAQAMTFDQAVNKLISSGWARQMETKCVSFKGNSLGFRAGGTPSDDACARWIAQQMKLAGLSNVRLEAVPVDEWDFKGASVTFGGTTYRASSFGGVAPTPAMGISGDVVYVKDVDLVNGPWVGSAGAFDAVGDVTGKIVLVDFASAMWWMYYPAMEAGLRGAAAVILTYNPDWPGYYAQPDALGCFDAESDLSAPPMVWLPWSSGDKLKAALGAGPVTASVKNNAVVRLADDGGVGYNVVASIPGTSQRDQYVIFGGHHDSWFKGGLDNASSVVDELVIAKAMKMSGYKPKRTVVFLSTTAEEYGYTNAYYDWCIGAWHFITQRHPEWSGRIAGMLNAEILGHKDGNLWMLASPEVQPMLTDAIAANEALTTWQGRPAAVIGDTWCWNDQWTFTAAGVPSVSFWSQDGDYNGVYKNTIYHTQYDVPALIDWAFFGNIAKFQFRVSKKFDRGLLPYSLDARTAHLNAALSAEVADGSGVSVADAIQSSIDGGVYADFNDAKQRYSNAADTFDSLAAHGMLSPATLPAVNARLMAIEKNVNRGMTALNWLDYTVYPFDQVGRDVYHLQNAMDALNAGVPDYDTAAAEVSSVGLMWYGTNFSEPVFKRDLQRHRQSYYRVTWGGQGHLARYQDMIPDYQAILAHDYDAATSLVSAKLDFQAADLESRMVDLTAVLNDAAEQIEDVLPLVPVS